MKIIAQCPQCGSSWLLGIDACDKRIKCRQCRKLFKVPTLEEVPKAARVIKQAKGTVFVDETGRIYG